MLINCVFFHFTANIYFFVQYYNISAKHAALANLCFCWNFTNYCADNDKGYVYTDEEEEILAEETKKKMKEVYFLPKDNPDVYKIQIALFTLVVVTATAGVAGLWNFSDWISAFQDKKFMEKITHT